MHRWWDEFVLRGWRLIETTLKSIPRQQLLLVPRKVMILLLYSFQMSE